MEGADSTSTESQKPQGRNRRWRNRIGKKPVDTTGTAPSEGTKPNGNEANPVKAAGSANKGGPANQGNKSNGNKSSGNKPVAAVATTSTGVANPTEQRPLEAAGTAANDGTKPKRRNRGGRKIAGARTPLMPLVQLQRRAPSPTTPASRSRRKSRHRINATNPAARSPWPHLAGLQMLATSQMARNQRRQLAQLGIRATGPTTTTGSP
ncbi:hypothetical protein GE09DRAFT_1160406 [Coniochaeta sp. 2T2.1]|nr:hypothetical protein GE09DRAFT_1160406 [Coniochaeta sp. 2T2.1]